MIKSYDTIPKLKQPSALALGYFDGVHLGHKTVLKNAVDSCLYPIAFTFKSQKKLLDTKKHTTHLFAYSTRRQQMLNLGIKSVVEPEFADIKDIHPQEFVSEILIKRMSAKLIVCGNDYRFGKNATGDVEFLKKVSADYGVDVKILSRIKYLGLPISSTRIKEALSNGQVFLASKMLGFDYYFKSEVIEGDKLGRTINYPTINQKFEPLMFIPKQGVYASSVLYKGKFFRSITNIGLRPTVSNNTVPIAETHILNFSSNLYGKTIKVILLDYIRSEKSFCSLDQLKKEIAQNIKQADLAHKNYFKNIMY